MSLNNNLTDSITDTTSGLLVTKTLSLSNVGSGFKVKEGTNAKMGQATLVAGTVTVSTTAVGANSRIFLTIAKLGTVAAPKAIAVTTTTAGTSFVITSADSTDTSSINWIIFDPS